MKKSMAIIAILAMTISLTGCFPTEKDNYNSKKQRESKIVSINDLNNMEKHITENIQKNLKADADINICIGNEASVYLAESMNIEYDKEWIGQMCPEKKILDRYGAEENNDVCLFDNDISTIKKTSSLGQYSYKYIDGKEYSNRNIEWLYKAGNDFNGTINFEKDTLWKQNDLSFMTNTDACELVKDKLEAIGIEAIGYQAYSVDFEYIKKQETLYNSELFEDEEKLHYSKDDEFYVVIPNIEMKNGAILPQLTYWLNADDDKEVFSSMVFAIVNKSGIIYLNCEGLFENICEKEEHLKVVSFEGAFETIKDYYKNVDLQQQLIISDIKLAYVPYESKDKENTFELRPSWIFYVVKEGEDGAKTRCTRIVDAIDGHRVVFDQEDTF